MPFWNTCSCISSVLRVVDPGRFYWWWASTSTKCRNDRSEMATENINAASIAVHDDLAFVKHRWVASRGFDGAAMPMFLSVWRTQS